MRAFASLTVTALGALLLAGPAAASDEPGSRDHPLVGRYEGARIAFYKAAEFDEAALLQAPHDYAALLERNATHDRSGPEWLRLEGRVTRIRYEIPAGRSSLEVMRNYESALKAAGFTIAFNCVDRACFRGAVQDPYLLGQQLDTNNNETSLYLDRARYMLAKLDRPEGSVHAAILTGDYQQRVTAFLEVVEAKAMDGGKVAVPSAGELAKAITEQKSVNVYGIVFDFDKDTLRPESKPTLDEIAKLLAEKPDLRLDIVGHTDDRGSANYNMELSQRRAASVVTALTRDYGIAAVRLTASGAGLTSPVASNDTEEGRAQNRRVELIAK